MASYPFVGTVGRGLFDAAWMGPEGKSVLFSGAIRVHRIGGMEDPARRYVFECHGKGWPGSYLEPGSAYWCDAQGQPVDPVASEGVVLATDADYGVILSVIKRLERLLPAQTDPVQLESAQVGLSRYWQYRRQAG
jgi:hypothetical protein